VLDSWQHAIPEAPPLTCTVNAQAEATTRSRYDRTQQPRSSIHQALRTGVAQPR